MESQPEIKDLKWVVRGYCHVCGFEDDQHVEAQSIQDVPNPLLCRNDACRAIRAALPPDEPKPKTFYAGVIERWTSAEHLK